MDELATLIRLAKLNLDEKRKALADILSDVDRVQQRIDTLKITLEKEQNHPPDVLEGGLTRGAFIQSSLKKIEAHEVHKHELMQIVEALQEEIRVAFEILKRYEIAAEQRDLTERKERLRRETKIMDEVGSRSKNADFIAPPHTEEVDE